MSEGEIVRSEGSNLKAKLCKFSCAAHWLGDVTHWTGATHWVGPHCVEITPARCIGVTQCIGFVA